MRKKLLLLSLIFTSFAAFAQFEVREATTDALIANGSTIAFNETGSSSTADYNWKFKVTNTSASDIYVRIFVDNMTNTFGSDFQLCFAGVCLNTVSVGSGYPSNPALITPGQSNVAGNSLWNQHPAGTTDIMDWTFRYQAFDVNGNEIGTPFILTYSYNLSLSVETSEITDLNIFPSNVKDRLTVTTNEVLNAEIFNVLGTKVKQLKTGTGTSIFDLSDLSSQIYIIRFTSASGKQITKKIIKQ